MSVGSSGMNSTIMFYYKYAIAFKTQEGLKSFMPKSPPKKVLATNAKARNSSKQINTHIKSASA